MTNQEFLTLEEAIQYTGMGRSTIYYKSKLGEFKIYHIGKRNRRFLKSELDEYMKPEETIISAEEFKKADDDKKNFEGLTCVTVHQAIEQTGLGIAYIYDRMRDGTLEWYKDYKKRGSKRMITLRSLRKHMEDIKPSVNPIDIFIDKAAVDLSMRLQNDFFKKVQMKMPELKQETTDKAKEDAEAIATRAAAELAAITRITDVPLGPKPNGSYTQVEYIKQNKDGTVDIGPEVQTTKPVTFDKSTKDMHYFNGTHGADISPYRKDFISSHGQNGASQDVVISLFKQDKFVARHEFKNPYDALKFVAQLRESIHEAWPDEIKAINKLTGE